MLTMFHQIENTNKEITTMKKNQVDILDLKVKQNENYTRGAQQLI